MQHQLGLALQQKPMFLEGAQIGLQKFKRSLSVERVDPGGSQANYAAFLFPDYPLGLIDMLPGPVEMVIVGGHTANLVRKFRSPELRRV
jgi:hypothetical protein